MKKHNDDKSHRLSNDQLEFHLLEGLKNLEQFNQIYDAGRPYIAFSMTTEICRILTDNNYLCRIRGSKIFTTPDFDFAEDNIMPQFKLICMKAQFEPASIEFIPRFMEPNYKTRNLKFTDWWNREHIWVEGVFGGRSKDAMRDPEMLTAAGFAKREKISRRELTTLMRNKLGAHLDKSIPTLLREFEQAVSFGAEIEAGKDGKIFSTKDGSLPMTVSPGPAMVRQISHEILAAYRET